VVLEIACDESGYEGEKLIGTSTDVFAHATVRLDPLAAAACMARLRDRIRSPATEYKANHLLRAKHRAVLVWLLSPASPLSRHGHVFLIDKAFFVLQRLAEVLPGVAPRLDRSALDFLMAANNLLRVKTVGSPVAAFFCLPQAAAFAGARTRAEEFRRWLAGQPRAASVLDPLIPSLVRAVAYWAEAGAPVAIVHDRQRTLPAERVARLGPATTARLAGIRMVNSAFDARVQLADILAGVARKIASDELNGHGDAELTALLRPYVDGRSIWGDDRSWRLIAPDAG
jgi:hypothetical protein